ncbi:hypothetical protein CR105_16095 [Massilia eurypsychrophila]|uniref:Arc-like DNA binding domain-containing protein n=1 Tax=Massilia eurypsychrophila TaxID=1485217 RepID=A0A2G8TCW4_9BURK|nr:hypothetical protein CR105_16095 [Massilia eurypsychrophila]
MSATKQQNSFPLRMPEELRARIEGRAATTGRSANSEIVWMLTAMLERGSDLATVPVETLLDELVNRLDAKLQIVVQDTSTHVGVEPAKRGKKGG